MARRKAFEVDLWGELLAYGRQADLECSGELEKAPCMYCGEIMARCDLRWHEPECWMNPEQRKGVKVEMSKMSTRTTKTTGEPWVCPYLSPECGERGLKNLGCGSGRCYDTGKSKLSEGAQARIKVLSDLGQRIRDKNEPWPEGRIEMVGVGKWRVAFGFTPKRKLRRIIITAPQRPERVTLVQVPASKPEHDRKVWVFWKKGTERERAGVLYYGKWRGSLPARLLWFDALPDRAPAAAPPAEAQMVAPGQEPAPPVTIDDCPF